MKYYNRCWQETSAWSNESFTYLKYSDAADEYVTDPLFVRFVVFLNVPFPITSNWNIEYGIWIAVVITKFNSNKIMDRLHVNQSSINLCVNRFQSMSIVILLHDWSGLKWISHTNSDTAVLFVSSIEDKTQMSNSPADNPMYSNNYCTMSMANHW